MDFSIRVRRNIDRSVVFEMSGKLRVGEAVLRLREFINTELQNGVRHILLDMGAVSSVDSSGLGEMVSSVTIVQARGGSLKMTGLHKGPAAMTEMTGLEAVFNRLSPISPPRKTPHWKTFGIAIAIMAVAAAFYWIARS